jgi:hypothetical protein
MKNPGELSAKRDELEELYGKYVSTMSILQELHEKSIRKFSELKDGYGEPGRAIAVKFMLRFSRIHRLAAAINKPVVPGRPS